MKNTLSEYLDFTTIPLLKKKDYVQIATLVSQLVEKTFSLGSPCDVEIDVQSLGSKSSYNLEEFETHFIIQPDLRQLSITAFIPKSSSYVSLVAKENWKFYLLLESEFHTQAQLGDILENLIELIKPILISRSMPLENPNQAIQQPHESESATPTHKKTYFGKPSEYWTEVGAIATVIGVIATVVINCLI